MGRKISTVLFGLLFLAGFGLLAYPTISDQWNNYRQSKLISGYEEAVSEMEPEDFKAQWKAARRFNKSHNLLTTLFRGPCLFCLSCLFFCRTILSICHGRRPFSLFSL